MVKDNYDKPDVFDRIIDWSETREARILGHRSIKCLGALVLAISIPLTIKGVWDHDASEIILGVAGTFNGNFLAQMSHNRLQALDSLTQGSEQRS